MTTGAPVSIDASQSLQTMREDMAAVFRWSARLGMHESVANHFSLAVNEAGDQFLVNPLGRHFSNMRASDLMLLDARDSTTMDRKDAPDPSAWAIHSAIHRNVPHARCVLHLHPQYATALASLKDSSLPPIDQNTMRYFNRFAIDKGFDGMGLGDEAERLSSAIGDHSIVLMGNHGLMSVGPTVAIAFNHLYYFERACRNYITALSTGRPLSIVTDEIAEKTAQQWDGFTEHLANGHLSEIRAILDREQPEYRD